jgi:hypothetical protein
MMLMPFFLHSHGSDDDKLRIVEESFTGHRQVDSDSSAEWYFPLASDHLAAAV